MPRYRVRLYDSHNTPLREGQVDAFNMEEAYRKAFGVYGGTFHYSMQVSEMDFDESKASEHVSDRGILSRILLNQNVILATLNLLLGDSTFSYELKDEAYSQIETCVKRTSAMLKEIAGGNLWELYKG